MKTVCDLNMCAGCMLCKDICPKSAISIKDDYLHYNAIIDETKCITCSLCEKKCPQNNSPTFRKPLWYKQGWSSDEKQRELSSSGGVAYELMRFFLKEGAICSCTLSDGEFVFKFAFSEKELKTFTGSKYVKSNPEGVYKKIKECISQRKKVLFVGLPCQVASVINYVGDSEYLYTADLICHGSPSPNILFDYLNQKNVRINSDCNFEFRKRQQFRLFQNDKPIEESTQDNYMTAFLTGLSYTTNCYSCKYAQFERVSDITLGDSWNSNLSNEEAKKGISLILCQTSKGIELVENSSIQLYDVDIERAVKANHQLTHPTVEPKGRKYFLEKVRKGKKVDHIMLRISPKREIKNLTKRLLAFLHLR